MQYKKQEIRDKIVKAAADEFEQNGFSGALIKNIAKNSGVPIGNIYRYFPSKTEMFDAAVEKAYNNLPIIINSIYEKEKTKDFKVKDLAKDIAANLINNIFTKYAQQLFILVYKSEDTKYSCFMQELYDIVTKLLMKNLFSSKDEGALILCSALSKGFIDGLFDLFKNGKAENVEALAERLTVLYFYNIEERI